MLVPMVATVREHESRDELWIFAKTVGGSVGSVLEHQVESSN